LTLGDIIALFEPPFKGRQNMSCCHEGHSPHPNLEPMLDINQSKNLYLMVKEYCAVFSSGGSIIKPPHSRGFDEACQLWQ
jgi:hypothetical protein